MSTQFCLKQFAQEHYLPQVTPLLSGPQRQILQNFFNMCVDLCQCVAVDFNHRLAIISALTLMLTSSDHHFLIQSINMNIFRLNCNCLYQAHHPHRIGLLPALSIAQRKLNTGKGNYCIFKMGYCANKNILILRNMKFNVGHTLGRVCMTSHDVTRFMAI